jgi:hypothetical protein
VYTSAWTVTHNEANFESPDEFRPERWLDPDSKDVREASQPFSLGPRGCLGRKSVFFTLPLSVYSVFPLQLDSGKSVLCTFSHFLFSCICRAHCQSKLLAIANESCSFASMEMSLTLAKLHCTYDIEAVNPNLDWEGKSHCHVMWWKPDLWIRFTPRKISE